MRYIGDDLKLLCYVTMLATVIVVERFVLIIMITYYKRKKHIIQRSHLTRKIHKVWKCSCIIICSGEQFYCPKKFKQMDFYKLHHESIYPWEFLELNKKLQMLLFVTIVTKTFLIIQTFPYQGYFHFVTDLVPHFLMNLIVLIQILRLL